MNKIRALLLSVSVAAAGMIIPAAAAPQLACAATADSAALVVDTGSSATRYCVEIPHGGTNGLGLIKLAAQQYGLSYNLGFGGAAVCALNGVGVTSSSDCFADMPNFWGYYIGNGSGGWSWSGTGAGSISVDPGDVQGWAWGTGKDGSSHPQPPATRYEDVCTVKTGSSGSNDEPKSGGSGTKTERDAPSHNRTDGAATSDNGGSVADQGTTNHPREDQAGTGSRTDKSDVEAQAGSAAEIGTTGQAAQSVPILDASPVAMAAGTETPTQDPPLSGLIVLAGIIALVAAGAYTLKRPRGKHARR